MQDQRSSDFYDVMAGGGEMRGRVLRFAGTERGFLRAKTYTREFNESLRKAMGIPTADLELEGPDFGRRPGEYDRAMRVLQYRENSADVLPVLSVPVVGDDDPMPIDYPHEY